MIIKKFNKMKTTLIAKFRELENENVGSIPTLSKAIRSIKTTKGEVLKVFKKVVSKEEFDKSERNEILADLYSKIK